MKKFYFSVIGLVLFLFTSFASAQDIYMQVGILTAGAGTGTNPAYKDFTRISSIQFGAANSGTITGGGAGAGKASFRDIVITKNINISSTKFLQALAKGSHIARVAIVTTGHDRDGQEYVAHKMEFEDVLFTEASSSQIEGCPGNCPGIAESFKFTYGTIKITTYGANSKGDVAVTGVFDWNVAENISN